jgi:acyl-CoA thioester hydrolase
VTIKTQRLCVRIYYEDTDFSGRVYHASYLRFFERGRTEWLRAFGMQHSLLGKSADVTFAVTQLHVEFHAAGTIDDLLDVSTELDEIRGPLLIFHQTISRDDTKLATARVDVITLKGNRPARPPREILARLSGFTRRSPYRSAR